MTTFEQTDADTNWYSLFADDVVERLDTNRGLGLAQDEVQRRLALTGESAPVPKGATVLAAGDPTPRATPMTAGFT